MLLLLFLFKITFVYSNIIKFPSSFSSTPATNIKEKNVYSETDLNKKHFLNEEISSFFGLSEFLNLKNNCTIQNSCIYKQNSALNNSKPNCDCDDKCFLYGNCCLDADIFYQNSTLTKSNDESVFQSYFLDEDFVQNLQFLNKNREEFDCKEVVESNVFVYIRSKCPINYNNSFVRSKCESQAGSSDESNIQFLINFQDPFESLPVTSIYTNITYLNIHCAICNEDYFLNNQLFSFNDQLSKRQTEYLNLNYKNRQNHTQNLNQTSFNEDLDLTESKNTLFTSNFIYWQVSVNCLGINPNETRLNKNNLDKLIRNNLSYNNQTNVWTVNYSNEKGIEEKTFCAMKIIAQDRLKPYLRLCKPEIINKCDLDWPKSNLRTNILCHSYQNIVYHRKSSKYYRNIHCAECNRISLNELYCLPPLTNNLDILDGRTPDFQSFNVIFDVNFSEGGLNLVGRTRKNPCKINLNEIYDPFNKKCRNVICGFDEQFNNYECLRSSAFEELDDISYQNQIELLNTSIFQIKNQTDNLNNLFETNQSSNSTVLIEDSNLNVTTSFEDIIYSFLISNFSESFKKCGKINISMDEYLLLKNDSVYLLNFKTTLDKGNYNISFGGLLICVPDSFLNSNLLDKFESHYSCIAYFCLLLSIICLILYLIIFTLVPDLRNLSGLNLSSLCIALIMVYCSFIVTSFKIIQTNILFCKAIAVFKLYSLLASFFWTGIMAFDIYCTIQASLKTFKFKSGLQLTRFITYSAFCWFVPSLLVSFTWSVDYYDYLNLNLEYKPGLGLTKECWFTHRKALLLFFVIPAGLIIIINFIFFIITSKNLYLTSKQKNLKLSKSSSSKFDFNLYFRLFLLMGLTWTLGFFATYFETIYLWYLFSLCNTLQGLFIFVAFSCKKVILNKLKIKLSKCNIICSLFNIFNFFKFKPDLKNKNLTLSNCRTPIIQSTVSSQVCTSLSNSKSYNGPFDKVVIEDEDQVKKETKKMNLNRFNELKKNFNENFNFNTKDFQVKKNHQFSRSIGNLHCINLNDFHSFNELKPNEDFPYSNQFYTYYQYLPHHLNLHMPLIQTINGQQYAVSYPNRLPCNFIDTIIYNNDAILKETNSGTRKWFNE